MFRIIRKVIFWCLAISAGMVVVYRFVPVPFTPLMIIRLVEQKRAGEDMKWHYKWRAYDKISPHVPLAVFCAEDQKFLQHNGFDVEAIKKAMESNEKGKRLRGGSTISQQVAKNVFLWPGRTYVRKGLEAYFTFLIELIWPKQRIMEVYINVVEMGNGIYGAEAAAKKYWHTSAEKLSRQQAALLAAILPSPRKYSTVNPGPYVRNRQQWILRQMGHYGRMPDYREKASSSE
jgi:monofunctional glycosyltransferase